MKRFFALCLVAVAFATAPAFAGFQEGYDAYERGDYKTALREYLPLAEQGNLSAQYNLGLLYDNGFGVPQDYKQAAKWYTLSAEQGDAFAQYNLGGLYANGEGVPQDYKEAVKLYRLSAEQGLAEAQYNLGVMYELGDGVPQDYVRAHMWINLAASNDYDGGAEARGIVAKKMTPADISKAQDLARKCLANNYQGC